MRLAASKQNTAKIVLEIVSAIWSDVATPIRPLQIRDHFD